MGLRSFAARRLALFLLRHGDLDDLVRLRAQERCGSAAAAALPLWTHLAGAHRRVHELKLDPYHVTILWAASLVVAFRLRRERERDGKRGKPVPSEESARLSRPPDAVPLIFSCVAEFLSTVLILTFLARECAVRVTGATGAMATAELAGKYLFATSLWSILVSVLLVMTSAVWSALDPGVAATPSISGSTGRPPKQKGTTRRWRDALSDACVNAAPTAAFVISATLILYLAHAHLPLFRHALRGEVDLGLPRGVSSALSQTAFSFLGFCLFSKLLPMPPAFSAQEGTRKTKKYVHDPELVKRMNILAQEAMENVRARREAKKKLTRTYSDGNLLGKIKSASLSAPTYSELNLRPIVAPLTPPRRRNGARPSLAPLPEHEASAGGRHGGQNAQWPLNPHGVRQTSTRKAPRVALDPTPALTKKAPRVAHARQQSPNSVTDFPLAAPTSPDKDGTPGGKIAASPASAASSDDEDDEDESFRAFQKFLEGSPPKPKSAPSIKRTMSMGCFVPELAGDEDPFEF